MDTDKKIRVSVKVIVINNEGKLLTLRRSSTAPSRPLYWDLPGGTLEYGEDTKESITRETKEESGIDIKEIKLLDVQAGLNDKKQYWVTICYMAKTQFNKVLLSYEHDDFMWVTPKEFEKLKISPRNRGFVDVFRSNIKK